jgi:hypothetical protein
MPPTMSRVRSSERPTFTTISSTMGRMERMLASTGKSSRSAFRTRVKPEIFTAATP